MRRGKLGSGCIEKWIPIVSLHLASLLRTWKRTGAAFGTRGCIPGGLPQGVQVIGPKFREDLCLEAAEAIEARLGVISPIDPK